MCVVASSAEKWVHEVLLTTFMKQQMVTNPTVIHGLCAMTFQSAMHWSLRLAPTMMNHLTSSIASYSLLQYYNCDPQDFNDEHTVQPSLPASHGPVQNLHIICACMALNTLQTSTLYVQIVTSYTQNL